LIQVQRATAQSFFDYGVPSILPSKHLLRTQGIIETLLGSEKIRRSSEFIVLFAKLLIGRRAHFSLRCVHEFERRDLPNSIAPVSFSRLPANPAAA
jgi:hypothetical protein